MARTRKQPTRKRRNTTPEPVKLGHPCSCGQTATDRFVVTCAACECWWHGDCINFPAKRAPFVDTLICSRCSHDFKLKSKWRARCRLPSCDAPVMRSDTDYCTAEHAKKFWEGAIQALNDPEVSPGVLQWLVDRSHTKGIFDTVAPDNIPCAPRTLTREQEEWKQGFDAAVQAKEERQVCGFNPTLIGLQGEVCQGAAPFCDRHQNWTTTALKRWELGTMGEDFAALPDRMWLAKRAKFLVAGTTRFSKRRRMRAAYFLPYVWEEDNDSYFLDDNPEPFWNKHF